MRKNEQLKRLMPVIFMITFSFQAVAQQDTIKVHIEHDYIIKDGRHSFDSYVSRQTTYLKDGRLFRTVYFNGKSRQIDRYEVCFYDKTGRLVSKEIFDPSDKLTRLTKHSYNRKDLLSEIIIMDHKGGKLVRDHSIKYKYKNGRAVRKKKYNSRNKLIAKTFITYSPEGQKAKKETNYTRKHPEYDSIRTITTRFIYNKNGDITEKIIDTAYTDKPAGTATTIYNYNSKNLLTGIIQKDREENTIINTTRSYTPEGSLQFLIRKNSEGKEISCKKYEYKVHRINLGEHKSFLHDEKVNR